MLGVSGDKVMRCLVVTARGYGGRGGGGARGRGRW